MNPSRVKNSKQYLTIKLITMEYLELKVLPESPTIIRNDKDEEIATILIHGSRDMREGRIKHIATTINGYDVLLDAMILIFAELDRDELDNAKRIATEAYYNATKGVKNG
jgi:hypothetical protein